MKRFNQWWVDETRKYQTLVLSELREVEMELKALELKRDRLLSRRNELEFILTEIHNRREQSSRIQKPTCWAMSGECV